MSMWNKLFSNFTWKNNPDTSTPLSAAFLNRLNNAIDGIDDRVVTLKEEAENITNGTTQVGNAKTLDGHGAEYFAPLSRINGDYLTTSILEKALTAPTGISEYKLGGDGYNGGDLPHYAWTYSTAIVYKRAANSIVVMLVCEIFDRTLINRYGGTTWTGWVESANTADLANYLPTNGGGVIDGVITPLLLNNTSNANQSFIGFRGQGANLGFLGMQGGNPSYIHSDGATTYTILHTGNKPSGTYAGNGDATERTISVGGIGTLLHVHGLYSGCSCLVGEFGAFSWGAGGTTKSFKPAEVRFVNSALIIATADNLFNASGQAYTYDLL